VEAANSYSVTYVTKYNVFACQVHETLLMFVVCVQSELNRVHCNVSVQTEAGACTDRYTQVDVGHCTQWTQCIIDRTDQSVQAICTQSPAAVQVAPETSNAAIQALLADAELAKGLLSALSENKLNAESQTVGSYQMEEEACIGLSEKEDEVANSVSAVERVIEVIEDSPTHSGSDHSMSPKEQLQEDCSSSNIPATTAELTGYDSLSDTPAVHTPVTSGSISAMIEQQLPHQYEGGKTSQLSAVVQKQFPHVTAAYDICQPATFQPSFGINTEWRSHTATKYIYSFEQRTILARSLMLKQSSEISSISVQPCTTQASLTQNATQTSACLATNAKPMLEVCSTSRIEESGETATVTNASAALMPLVPAASAHKALVSVGGDDKTLANWQCSELTARTDNSSSQTQLTAAQAATTDEQLNWSSLLPSVSLPADVIQYVSLPATRIPNSANIINNSSHLAPRLEESPVNESVEHCLHPPTEVSLSVISSQITSTEGNKLPADDGVQLDGDSSKLSRNSEVPGCENMTASTCDESKAGQSESSAQNNSVSCYSGGDATAACHVDSGPRYDSKEQKAVVQTEVSRLGDCSMARGRRRPLFVHRGPLMETVMTTLRGSDSSPHHRLHRDSESSTRKLPDMLLGRFDCHHHHFSNIVFIVYF